MNGGKLFHDELYAVAECCELMQIIEICSVALIFCSLRPIIFEIPDNAEPIDSDKSNDKHCKKVVDDPKNDTIALNAMAFAKR